MRFARKQLGNLRLWAHLFFLFVCTQSLLLACASLTSENPEVILHSHTGEAVRVQVEIANTPEKRRYGLMYRKDMQEDHGMLFLFPQQTPQSFWMKNTVLSLDIVYINSARTIVHIAAHTTPFSETPIPSGQPAQFVLEVNAGFCERHGIASGDQVEFVRVAAPPLQ